MLSFEILVTRHPPNNHYVCQYTIYWVIMKRFDFTQNEFFDTSNPSLTTPQLAAEELQHRSPDNDHVTRRDSDHVTWYIPQCDLVTGEWLPLQRDSKDWRWCVHPITGTHFMIFLNNPFAELQISKLRTLYFTTSY